MTVKFMKFFCDCVGQLLKYMDVVPVTVRIDVGSRFCSSRGRAKNRIPGSIPHQAGTDEQAGLFQVSAKDFTKLFSAGCQYPDREPAGNRIIVLHNGIHGKIPHHTAWISENPGFPGRLPQLSR